MTQEAQNKVANRVDDWINHFQKNDDFQSIGIAQGLKGDIQNIINTRWELGDLDDHPF